MRGSTNCTFTDFVKHGLQTGSTQVHSQKQTETVRVTDYPAITNRTINVNSTSKKTRLHAILSQPAIANDFSCLENS
jgi:hypothetical protein